ncbi:MAG: hypothetical protein KBS74_06485 [Clostridiales bacterium]|nr:hypothetical protein [Candidatus Cacconaster stercorequi]
MKDITLVVLPLLLIAVAMVLAVSVFRQKDENRQMKFIIGMAVGISVGFIVGTMKFISMGLSISIGLLLGEWIGLLRK